MNTLQSNYLWVTIISLQSNNLWVTIISLLSYQCSGYFGTTFGKVLSDLRFLFT